MVKIVIAKNKDIISSISVLGHAKFADYGKDIVCSGLSSVVITTVNAILLFDKDYISYSENKNDVSIKIKEHNEIVDNLILNMINMLKDIENDYPDHVEIREEN